MLSAIRTMNIFISIKVLAFSIIGHYPSIPPAVISCRTAWGTGLGMRLYLIALEQMPVGDRIVSYTELRSPKDFIARNGINPSTRQLRCCEISCAYRISSLGIPSGEMQISPLQDRLRTWWTGVSQSDIPQIRFAEWWRRQSDVVCLNKLVLEVSVLPDWTWRQHFGRWLCSIMSMAGQCLTYPGVQCHADSPLDYRSRNRSIYGDWGQGSHRQKDSNTDTRIPYGIVDCLGRKWVCRLQTKEV